MNHDPGYRVPRIVADIVAARPIDIAIIDGVESIAAGEGAWIRGIRFVTTRRSNRWTESRLHRYRIHGGDGLRSPRHRGIAPFQTCDNTLLLAEGHGVGTTDLKRIEVRGVSIEQAMYRFEA